MTIPELNALDGDAFVQAIGWVFEHSPWVAERAWLARPFASVEDLHAKMVTAMHAASAAEQLALVQAHPDLGTRLTMSDVSQGEQTGAGLDRLTPSEYERLQRLNTDYRTRFGFPFLFAVRGSSPAQILQALEERLPRDPHDEFEEALRQVSRIARFRLEDVLT